MKLYTKVLVLLGVVALLTMTGFAATSATGVTTATTNAISPTLKVSVKVENAVQLTLSQVTGNCPITAGTGTDYAIDFGTVNGLGIASTSGGTTCATPTVNAGNATYTTQYQVTPKYSGFSSASAHISLTAPSFTTVTTGLSLVEGATTASLTAVPTSGTGDQFAVASSGTAITRVLGVQVSNGNGAGTLTGSDNTTVTFTMIIP